jgi:DNA gyrase/topoisomerase IV subunit A
MKIEEFLDREYKEYARYTISNRAIPCLIDGLKPSQRKIFFTALHHCKAQPIKTASLVGLTMANANYHHGDSSLSSAINLMTQDFTGSNNIPLFKGKGNFGNRLIQEAAAARYTSVQLNKEILKIFTDNDILEIQDDLDNPEPKTYLPTIPWVLVNGIEGVAVGFATSIFPRSMDLLKKVVSEKIKKGTEFEYKFFTPFFKGFKGTIQYNEIDNNWVITGCFKRNGTKIVEVTEIPVGQDREKYVTYLEKILSAKKIRDYDDYSKDEFRFIIKLNEEMQDEEIITLLKLRTTIKENITVLDPDGKLKEYESPNELINDFIKYRKEKYEQRISKIIKGLEDEVIFLTEKIKFSIVLKKGSDKILSFTKKELLDLLKSKGFVYYNELVNMEMYRFTKDSVEQFQERIDLINSKLLPEANGFTVDGLWLNDIKTL